MTRKSSGTVSDEQTTMGFSLSKDELESYRASAKRNRVSMSAWIRAILNANTGTRVKVEEKVTVIQDSAQV